MIPIEKLQEPGGYAEQYLHSLFRDIEYRSQQPIYTKLKTIYFGGGTPLLFGAKYILDIYEYIQKHFDTSTLQEITIECNPYPYETTLQEIREIMDTIQQCRIRFSFGIQSLDDTTLQLAGRDCTFAGLQDFTKKILEYKPSHVSYNYDFIAFGDGKEKGHYQNQQAEKWLNDLVTSHSIDSFSLYTLELFPGSKWYHNGKDPLISYQAPRDHDMPFHTSEDEINDQFDVIKKLFQSSQYQRYEISNYALAGNECIHNQVYRTMQEYIGIGIGAHGLLYNQDNDTYHRTEAVLGWKAYISDRPENIYTSTEQSAEDMLIESFFLGLRQKIGIENLGKYETILYENYQERIQKLLEEGLVQYENNRLSLTDRGMDIHHRICLFLLARV